ncbi:MAG: serine O-acetyltransferase [Pseudomonadota bacterium]
MQHVRSQVASVDPVWGQIREEAHRIVDEEPLLAGLVQTAILHQSSFEAALSYRIAQKLSSPEMSPIVICEIANEACTSDDRIGMSARADVMAVYDRDPACHAYIHPLLFFKGFLALQGHRIAHWLWQNERHDMARFFQMRGSEVFGVDIHPAAKIGCGVMFDHAHSIVIGETATVGDNVSVLHSVTLGGTGKADGDRHPKIQDCVMIGAGAAVLGNIVVGRCSRIAAGSVVLQPVAPMKTVAGVPARVIGEVTCDIPACAMDQTLDSPSTDKD